MADADFGEMFHNFPMPDRIRKYSGVDVSPVVHKLEASLKAEKQGTCLVRWSRLFMGMRPSPYNAVRYYYWGEDFIRGDPGDATNALRYNRIIMNLPCMEFYNPKLPKVMKWDDSTGAVAGDFITFVDDCRLTELSKEHCHEVHRQFASRVQFLGMQDAPRKFRPPSQSNAGAWTGTIFRIDAESITKSVSQAKWDKGRALVMDLKKNCDANLEGRPSLDRRELERTTGFLNHLTMTFDDAAPFLKGFYLTLNSWRPLRDGDDWKMADKRWRQELEDARANAALLDESAPSMVMASTRLASDLSALATIFSPEVVPRVDVRSGKILTVVYGFGDASGTGLGSTFTCGSGFNFRIRVWGTTEKEESSNWKEFTNVVEAMEEEGADGGLLETEVFMFTDNATVEACSTKGSSSSPKLLDLVIRLKAMTTAYGVKIHIYHVAGTRMIAQGTDGVSRGYLATGVMAGEAMSSFIPIYKSALERAPMFIEWIKEWAGSDCIVLNPMGWFGTEHDIDGWHRCPGGLDRPVLKEGRTYVWVPPIRCGHTLAALRKARIKRQTSTHVFVCPRLCCPLWLKQVYKAADIVLEFSAGAAIHWPACMHEPVLIAILFLFLRHSPWQLRNTPKMHAVGRKLHSLLEGENVDTRDFLFKFWEQCHRFGSMSESMVRRVLFFRPVSSVCDRGA
jgi:hypothetical protein